MRIYLAARYSRHPEMRGIRDRLHELGHTVTSRWIDQHGGDLAESIAAESLNSDPDHGAVYAAADLDDIAAADAVVSVTGDGGGGKGGRHVEFGYGLGLGKQAVVVGPRENVFHCLPDVVQFSTLEEFLEAVS